MSYPTVAEVQDAYSYLCDDPLQQTFTPAFFQRAFNAAYSILYQAMSTGQAPLIELMINWPLPPMTKSITPAQMGITDFADYIFLRERPFGSCDKYTDVADVDVLTQRAPVDKLLEQNYRNSTFYFIGATQLIDLQLKYETAGTAPTALGTQIMVDNSLEFLSTFAASRSLKLKGRDELAQDYFNQAVGPKYGQGTIGGQLFMLIQPLVRSRQKVQVAPHPYTVTRRYGIYRQVPYVSSMPGSTGSSSNNVPLQYSTANQTIIGQVDGINTVFWIVVGVTSMTLYLNGVTQTIGVDYVFTSNQITFLSGSVPQPGSIITADAFPVYSGTGNYGSAPSQQI